MTTRASPGVELAQTSAGSWCSSPARRSDEGSRMATRERGGGGEYVCAPETPPRAHAADVRARIPASRPSQRAGRRSLHFDSRFTKFIALFGGGPGPYRWQNAPVLPTTRLQDPWDTGSQELLSIAEFSASRFPPFGHEWLATRAPDCAIRAQMAGGNGQPSRKA